MIGPSSSSAAGPEATTGAPAARARAAASRTAGSVPSLAATSHTGSVASSAATGPWAIAVADIAFAPT